jgi:hypothetical protein
MTAVRAVTNQKNEVTQIVLTFSGAVNPAEAGSRATYRLTMPGKRGPLTATNARTIRLKSARYNAASNTVTLVPKTPFQITKPVKVLVEALHDSQGQLIDGDPFGQPGGNAIAILSRTGARTAAVTVGPFPGPVSVLSGVTPGALADPSSRGPYATDPAVVGALVELDVPDAPGTTRRARRHES